MARTTPNNFPLWVSAVLLLAAIGLALLRFPHSSLWYDETVSAYLATHSWEELWWWSAEVDIHPPFYFAVLKLWAALAGASAFSLRYFSLLASLLSLAALLRLGRNLGASWPAAWLSMGALSLSGGFLYATTEARGYSLVLMLGTLSLLFYKRQGKVAQLLYFICTVAALYVHYTALFLVAVQFLLCIGIFFKRNKCSKIWALALLFYLPWIFWRWRAGVPEGLAFEGSISPGDSLRHYWEFFLYGQVILSGQASLLALGAALGGLLLLLWQQRRYVLPLLLVAIPLGGLALSAALLEGKLAGRHAWLMWVGVALLVGSLPWAKALPWLLLSGSLSLLLSPTLPAQYPSDFAGAIRYINAEAQPGDVVLLRDGSLFTAVEYYDLAIPYVGLPDVPLLDLQRPLSFHEALQTLEASPAQAAEQFWVLSWQGDLMDVQALAFAIPEFTGGPPREVHHFGDVYLARYRVERPLQELFPHIVDLPGLLLIPPNNPSLLGVDLYYEQRGPGCPVIFHAWWWRGEADDPDARVSYRLLGPEGTGHAQQDSELSSPLYPQQRWLYFVPTLGRGILYLPEGVAEVEAVLVVYDQQGQKPEQLVPLESISIVDAPCEQAPLQ